MNKFSLLLLFISQSITAQVISINPSSANQGQTLNTTITLANGVLNMGSPPQQMSDVYLQLGTTTIYATNFSISPFFPHDDTVNADFSIPISAPPGLYDVHVMTYQMGFPPTSIDNLLQNGFSVNPNTAVESLSIEEKSFLYPNPVTDRSVLKIPNGKYTLSIIDISGREIFRKEVNEEYIIENKKFAEGVYYYRLTNSNSSLSGKFIVVNSY